MCLSAMSVALKHISDPPPPPSLYNPSIRPQLEAVVMRVLQKEPEDRYPNGAAFARALEDAMDMEDGRPLSDASRPVRSGPSAGDTVLFPDSKPSELLARARRLSTGEHRAAGSDTASAGRDQHPSTIRSTPRPLFDPAVSQVSRPEPPPRRSSLPRAAVLAVIALALVAVLVLAQESAQNAAATPTRTVPSDGTAAVLAAVTEARTPAVAAETEALAAGSSRTPTPSPTRRTSDASPTPLPATRIAMAAAATRAGVTARASTQRARTETAAAASATAPPVIDPLSTTATATTATATTATATTATATPTATPTVTSSATPTATPTATRTEVPTDVPDTAAMLQAQYESAQTQVNSDRNQIALLYNRETLVLVNLSPRTLDVSFLDFTRETGGSTLTFNTQAWEGGSRPTFALPANDCFQLWQLNDPELPAPDFCRIRHAWEAVAFTRWFWIASSADAQFTVSRFNEVLGTCPVNAGPCLIEVNEPEDDD
jgi:hypothetical protein